MNGGKKAIRLSLLTTDYYLLPLKNVFQCELYLSRPKLCVHRLAEARRFQNAHRNSEMRAIEQIKRFGTEHNVMIAAQLKILDDSQIGSGHAAGAERVTPDLAICAQRSQQIDRCRAQ